jgi:hypothetical protein
MTRLAIVPLMLLLGCLTGDKPRYSDRTKDVLSKSTKVEVFRIDGKNFKEKKEGEERIGGYPVTAKGKGRDQDFAKKLTAILLDETTYTDQFAKCYWPGVVFRVWKDKEAVDVIICFKCGNFYCGPPASDVRENGSFSGSPRRADLVRLAKEAFPDDKEIQALEEK